MTRCVAERVTCVRFGAERQELVKAGHLVTQHSKVERRTTQRCRRQVDVTLHVVQVLQHPGVALQRRTANGLTHPTLSVINVKKL